MKTENNYHKRTGSIACPENCTPFEALKSIDAMLPQQEKGFYCYLEENILNLSTCGHEGLAKAYQSTLHSLKRYFGESDFPFSTLTPLSVTSYYQRLLQSGVCKNTAGFYLHNMKAIYMRGCRELGLDLPSPFSALKIGAERTLKRALPIEEIRMIAHLPLYEGTPEALARDLFMFSLYTRGMAFVDIAFLRKANISVDELYYKRHKTGKTIRIGINRQMRDLFEKYEGENGDYLFPLINNSESLYTSYRRSYYHMRYALKKVALQAGMKSPLRFHAARHSWAVIAYESGAPIQTISECLGHSSERITRIYLKDLDRSVLDSLNDLVAERIG